MRAGVWAAMLLACGGATAAPAAPGVVDGVLRYESPPRTFRTNAFFIDAPEGLILVDTGFLAST